MPQTISECIEIRLDALEERLETATLLARFPAALFTYFLIMSPIFLFGLIAILQFGAHPLEISPSGFLSFVGFAILATFFWSWGIARLSRPVILLPAVIFALVLFGFMIEGWINVSNDLNLPVATKVFANVVALLIYFGCGLRMLTDSWRLACTPGELREFFTTVNHGISRRPVLQTVSNALGIHPLCRWIPSKFARVAAGTSYILASYVRGFVLLLLLYQRAWIAGLLAFPILIAVVSGFRFVARRLTRISLEDLTGHDHRPPVLFLRSFRDDLVRLARPQRPFFRWVFGLGEPSPRLDHVAVEEGTPRGPVVALGVPGSPPPFGAARTYVDDDEWQAAVARLASTSSAIVIVVDDTEGVLWELDHIRDTGYDAKTLYLLPPRLTDPKQAARFIRSALSKASLPADGNDAVSSQLEQINKPCIGWFCLTNGKLAILTVTTPTKVSYACALRLALGRHHQSVNRDDSVASLPSGKSTQNAAIELGLPIDQLPNFAAQKPLRTSPRWWWVCAIILLVACVSTVAAIDYGGPESRHSADFIVLVSIIIGLALYLFGKFARQSYRRLVRTRAISVF